MVNRSRAHYRRAVLALLVLILITACGPKDKPLAPRTQTFGELRSIRGNVTVTPPGEAKRPLLPRERIIDGEVIDIPPNALAWLRRDGGATLLVQGPAALEFGAEKVTVDRGRVFIDSPSDDVTTIKTPEGLLNLVRVRASLDVNSEGKPTEAYVLSGEVRTEAGVTAGPGQSLLIAKNGTATVKPAVAWVDWTGGLATTDRSVQPPPYGVGTVGARPPGEQGAPRAPLAIRRMDVRVRVEGDLATTEVDQLFFNGASETVEGIYSFRTPQGASLLRFGVDRGGVIVWGRVKEKKAAAKQYASHVYEGSKDDPALLEWEAPGVYRARLYPIEAGATRRVIVRYTDWLQRSGDRGQRRFYAFPMAAEGTEESMPHIEFFGATFDFSLAGAKEVRAGMKGTLEKNKVIVRAHDLVPRADLALELFDDGLAATPAFRASHGLDEDLIEPSDRAEERKRARAEPDYLLIPIRASDVPRPEGGLDLVIVIDTSAAMDDASLSIARAAVNGLLSHLAEQDRALVWAGDATLRPVTKGWTKLRAVNDAVRRDASAGLATLHRGGATDLGAMLTEAAASIDPTRRGAVVYIGDGNPTVGELALADLNERMAKLPRPVRTFGLGVGQDANMAIIEGLAKAGFAERLGDAAAAVRASLRILETAERPAWLGVDIDLGPTVERIVPRELDTLVADESVLIVGRLTGDMPKNIKITTPAGENVLRIQPQRIAHNGDLQARWAGGRLRQLLADGVGRAALVDLGVRAGVITPFTSLYVPTKNEMSPAELDELRRKQQEQFEKREGTRAVGELDLRYVLADLPLLFAGCSEFKQASESRSSDPRPAGESEDLPKEQPAAPPVAVATATATATAAPNDDPPKPATDTASRAKDKPAESEVASEEKAKVGENSDDQGKKPWGRDDSLGNDPLNARGTMWGDSIGDSYGAAGLGLSGIGEGGGARGEGVGLGGIGSVGHGAGTGTGQGFGSGHGRLGGSHAVRAPSVRMGSTTVTGSLPPEVVQRIVRQNHGRFRLCYENGLTNNPNLQGRVIVRFIVGHDGSVSNVANAGSDLPDPAVVGCVARAYQGLTFPQPERGIVTVVYPIIFTPGDAGTRPMTGEPHSTPTSVHVTVQIGELPHNHIPCAPGSILPFAERVQLWKERLGTATGNATGNATGVAQVYSSAITSCEAPTWRERAKLQSMMLDALPTVGKRVELWRMMQGQQAVADALYRGILARVRNPAEVRELHQALGLKSVDPGLLDKLIEQVKAPADRVKKLRELRTQWPDDFTLALRLLESLEDAGDDGAARILGRELRNRPDADAHVLTEVGELHLRLAKRGTKEQAGEDEAEARRTFGEIVEFAPDEPIARRRLGDLLRAHRWFAEAARQYETLARLSPDDSSLPLLHAASAQGMGKLDEAVRWAEKVNDNGAPGDAQGLARTARALASVYLAWGRAQAANENKANEVLLLRKRTERLLNQDDRSPNSIRVVLLWSHPELHPTLWSNALGSMMPAHEGDATLGISQVIMAKKSGAAIEVRMEKQDAEHAARLGAQAILTFISNEGKTSEKLVALPVGFQRGGDATLRFNLNGTEVTL